MPDLHAGFTDPLLVAAGLLRRASGDVLVQQRPAGRDFTGLWEFPGGKIGTNESPEEALARELCEELGIIVDASALVPLSFTTTVQKGRALILLLFTVDHWQGTPEALHADQLRWVKVEELRRLAMPPADLPFIPLIEGRMTSQ
jgi:8-oxo-dGTP diphosphatase